MRFYDIHKNKLITGMRHNMTTASTIIKQLGLTPHPEGGYFKETYRSREAIAPAALPNRFEGPRNLGTAIYFLLKSSDVSCFHRIKADEMWYFHYGSPLTIHLLQANGFYRTMRLGLGFEKGQQPQVLVPQGVWFGATVDAADSFTLSSCTTFPGFDFADFELAGRSQLLQAYPQHADIIKKLTPPTPS